MQEPRPITVAIERTVDSELDRYAQAWVRHGVDLAAYFPGFLGAGWVRESRGSKRWHMLYRFEDAATLEAWERSPERQQWIASGAGFASESRVERRTGARDVAHRDARDLDAAAGAALDFFLVPAQHRIGAAAHRAEAQYSRFDRFHSAVL